MAVRLIRCAAFVSAMIVALSALAGCASLSYEDAVPTSAPAQPVATSEAAVPPASPAAAPPTAQFANPGDYPNLNVIPQPAAAQITDAERDLQKAFLRSVREQQKSGGGSVRSATDGEELRRLGKRHAEDAIREIEGN